jgi:hypothetical protein
MSELDFKVAKGDNRSDLEASEEGGPVAGASP